MCHVEAFTTSRDQNWTKRSKPFSGGRSMDQGDIRTAEKTTNKNARLQFDLWPLEIKRSRASEGNDQAIKHTFCRSKNLIADAFSMLLQAPCQTDQEVSVPGSGPVPRLILSGNQTIWPRPSPVYSSQCTQIMENDPKPVITSELSLPVTGPWGIVVGSWWGLCLL